MIYYVAETGKGICNNYLLIWYELSAEIVTCYSEIINIIVYL